MPRPAQKPCEVGQEKKKGDHMRSKERSGEGEGEWRGARKAPLHQLESTVSWATILPKEFHLPTCEWELVRPLSMIK